MLQRVQAGALRATTIQFMYEHVDSYIGFEDEPLHADMPQKSMFKFSSLAEVQGWVQLHIIISITITFQFLVQLQLQLHSKKFNSITITLFQLQLHYAEPNIFSIC